MADPQVKSDRCGSANTDERFTIRWVEIEDGIGEYKVSVPNLERADVVLAEHYDRLRAENARYREALEWYAGIYGIGAHAQTALASDETEPSDA